MHKVKNEDDVDQMQDMKNSSIQGKGDRYSARGVCIICDTGMFKFLTKDDAEKLAEE